MKKQINPTIKAHLIRGAFYLLLLLAVCAIPFALAQRNAAKQSVPKPAIKPNAPANMYPPLPGAPAALATKPAPNISGAPGAVASSCKEVERVPSGSVIPDTASTKDTAGDPI